jgi:hypothetical protein
MTPRLRAYLALERAMLELDEQDDPLADRLRDAMDPLWYGLTDADHAALDARDGRMSDGERATPGTRAGVTESTSEISHALPMTASMTAEARTLSGSNLEAA